MTPSLLPLSFVVNASPLVLVSLTLVVLGVGIVIGSQRSA